VNEIPTMYRTGNSMNAENTNSPGSTNSKEVALLEVRDGL